MELPSVLDIAIAVTVAGFCWTVGARIATAILNRLKV